MAHSPKPNPVIEVGRSSKTTFPGEHDEESRRLCLGACVCAFQRLTRVVLASPLPVLCAIDGWCVGGALEFSASCDLRVCTDRVQLLTPEVNIGFVFSNGAAFFLPHVLGETRARELLQLHEAGTFRMSHWSPR